MNRYLRLVRTTLLVLIAVFIVIFIYRYVTIGTVDYLMLTPIVGLLIFYFITRP